MTHEDMKGLHTDPMARKKEKVAALLSIYCDRVAMNPRGPEPCLLSVSDYSSVTVEVYT
jgi:hypothetical protein